MKIALLLLNNNGDILYATPIARQIKEFDFPGCHLTWIVAKQCSDLLKNNPYVDELEIVQLGAINEIYAGKWKEIKRLYEEKFSKGEYDKLFILQPYEKNLLLYRFSIRKMILESYPFPIKGSLKPFIVLSDIEKENVRQFIGKNKIDSYQNKILFEFAPSSGQSTISVSNVMKIAERIVRQNPSTCVILSSGLQFQIDNSNIFNARTLSFKENAELINQCTLLLGCSSGISWLSTSEYCKAVPTIQYLNKKAPWFNSLRSDFIINGFDTTHIIELYDFNDNLIVDVVIDCLAKGFVRGKEIHDQPLRKRYLLNNFISISEFFFAHNAYRNFVLFFLKNLNKGLPFVNRNLRLLVSIGARPFKKLIRV